MAQRTTAQTLAWLRNHQSAAQLGFNPNGRCLEIARLARNIGPKYGSAVVAQRNTPAVNRIKLKDIRPGMVMYFDDPHDSNKYGHIVTVDSIRTVGGKPAIRSLADIVVWTNSVKSGWLVRVCGDYFPEHWGDPFVYGANILNGVRLILSK